MSACGFWTGFSSTPTIFANLEKLAGECDMSRPTLRRHMQELSKAGLFRFDTPPYWKRKSGFATEISFPTKTVEKWLRDNGFFMTNPGKKFAMVQSRKSQ